MLFSQISENKVKLTFMLLSVDCKGHFVSHFGAIVLLEEKIRQKKKATLEKKNVRKASALENEV